MVGKEIISGVCRYSQGYQGVPIKILKMLKIFKISKIFKIFKIFKILTRLSSASSCLLRDLVGERLGEREADLSVV